LPRTREVCLAAQAGVLVDEASFTNQDLRMTCNKR
jgi:hypothetical protein